MERESSDYTEENLKPEFNSLLEVRHDDRDEIDGQVSAVSSVDVILPDELLECIFSYLPIASIFRVSCLCKKWNEIVASKRFIRRVSSQKPWYWILKCIPRPAACAYDPTLGKWHNISFPYIWNPYFSVASSGGLVSFSDHEGGERRLCICNPIARSVKRLTEPPGPDFSQVSALAVSVNRATDNYNIYMVRCVQVVGGPFEWEISILVYDSAPEKWITALTEAFGWRGSYESVICDGALYFLILSTEDEGPDTQHGVVMYKYNDRIGTTVGPGLLLQRCIPAPCRVTCVDLMNLREKVVMVGGIMDPDYTIHGIGVWVLKGGREWEEISRMPSNYFEGFREFGEQPYFSSSGSNGLTYIHRNRDARLFAFDFDDKEWIMCGESPITKGPPPQIYNGLCFEPRLDVQP